MAATDWTTRQAETAVGLMRDSGFTVIFGTMQSTVYERKVQVILSHVHKFSHF